ncbi:MAG TPA: class F sortase [Mycobacteriales bacterium]|nr:class F sortase [Mycobacteriales bacterium]
MPTSTRNRPLRWIAVALLSILALTGVSACGSHDKAADPAKKAAVTASATPTPSPTRKPGLERSIPTTVDIPSIGARSSLVQLGVNADKSVQVPPVSEPLQAGWYKYGPTPGEIGPAVILGHIDGNHQEGIFWRLHEVKVGDVVHVKRQDGRTLTFTVRKVDQVSKKAFPTSAVYGNTPDAQLRLITCGGAFDASTRNYLDNIIVYATLRT